MKYWFYTKAGFYACHALPSLAHAIGYAKLHKVWYFTLNNGDGITWIATPESSEAMPHLQ